MCKPFCPRMVVHAILSTLAFKERALSFNRSTSSFDSLGPRCAAPRRAPGLLLARWSFTRMGGRSYQTHPPTDPTEFPGHTHRPTDVGDTS